MRPAFCLILFLLLSGCATPYSTVIRSYQGAAISCKSVKDFEFESLAIGESKSFDINEKSPVYLFDTGKSFFKAFALPQTSYPYQVSISSYMLGDRIKSAYIFYPQAATLNEDFEVVRSTDSRSFQLQKAGFAETIKETWGLMYKIEGRISFTEENKTEKYLIILTTDELLMTKTPLAAWRSVPIIFPGVVGAIPVGKEEVLVPHSPAGRINVSVLGQDQGDAP